MKFSVFLSAVATEQMKTLLTSGTPQNPNCWGNTDLLVKVTVRLTDSSTVQKPKSIAWTLNSISDDVTIALTVNGTGRVLQMKKERSYLSAQRHEISQERLTLSHACVHQLQKSTKCHETSHPLRRVANHVISVHITEEKLSGGVSSTSARDLSRTLHKSTRSPHVTYNTQKRNPIAAVSKTLFISNCRYCNWRLCSVNPLTPKISLVILLTVCNTILVMLIWRIWNWINQ